MEYTKPVKKDQFVKIVDYKFKFEGNIDKKFS